MASPVTDTRRDLRILVIADDPLARTGLSALLGEHPECTVVGEIPAGADILAAVEARRPDVLLWDLGWNAEAALEHLGDLRDYPLASAVLLPDESLVPEAVGAGARGVLLRQAEPAMLVTALDAVARGLTVIDPALAAAVLPGRDRALPGPVEDLTPRERTVLQLLAEGLSNKVIAERLAISEHTVKFHVNAILSKLGAQSRTEAVTRAARLGLITL
jgi:DNA-binding NarL/FixJ family response regulator